MIARRHEINLQVNQFVDALLLGMVFWFAHFIRFNGLIILDNLWTIEGFERFIWILAVIMPFGPFLLEMQGFYNYPLEKSVWKSLRQIAAAGLWLFVLLGSAVIFLRIEVPSRSVLILFGLFAPGALLLRERLYIWDYVRRLRRGAIGERIIVAGERASMRDLMNSLSPSQKLEVQVVAAIDLEAHGVETLVEALHRHAVGRVVLAFHRIELDKVQRAIEACETEGVEAWLNADFIHTSIARPSYELLAKKPMLVFRATPELSWAMLVKASSDRVLAAIGLVVLFPLFVLIALAIFHTSPGPVFFRQRRAGLHGDPFEMWKFRTMCAGAEHLRDELASRNVMQGPVFKVEDDPRVTKFGKWLRRTSIDELPQLFNVLKGEMSLVGPRPLPVYEVEKFERPAHRRRLSMKPGLTCLWQIRGRNKVTDFQDWVRMDLEYIDNWSVFLDLYILVRTIPAVLVGKGAK
ncbi:MAG: sugar transferase [Terrimicrobiaceae bacterium]|nr:sugar transferase [Terrimicrobiaceae bacterium]